MKTNDSIGGVGKSVVVGGEELIQIAFSVPDLAVAMDWWTDETGIGHGLSLTGSGAMARHTAVGRAMPSSRSQWLSRVR